MLISKNIKYNLYFITHEDKYLVLWNWYSLVKLVKWYILCSAVLLLKEIKELKETAKFWESQKA